MDEAKKQISSNLWLNDEKSREASELNKMNEKKTRPYKMVC